MRTLSTILESTHLSEAEIHEAEKSSELLSNDDIGLLLVDEAPHRLFMLFSLSRFEKQLDIVRVFEAEARGRAYDESGKSDSEEVYADLYDKVASYTLSVMDASTHPGDSGPCWGAAKVYVTAAEKGYGPAIYEIGLASMGSLIPDRGSVSLSARSVWKKFLKRSDIDAKPLDNKHQPSTPSPVDDCKVYFKTPDERTEVDYAFQLTPASKQKMLSSVIPTLTKRADKLFKRLNFRIDDEIAENFIYAFFRLKYR